MPAMSALAMYVVGVAVLILGRKLFWIFVAAVGFIAALLLAPQYLPPETSQWVVLAIALGAGIIGALLAILIQKIAVAVAGFIAGGYLALWLLSFFSVNLGEFQSFTWIVFIVGGIIGTVLMIVIFDIALIILSSGAGAGLISYQLNISTGLPQIAIVLIFVVLFVIGLVIQFALMRSEQAPRRRT